MNSKMPQNKGGRDAYISMDKLAVGYNGKAIIKDICIDIGKGEIVTLIGPNGAGKSTLMKSITRQLSLISGKVWYGDQNLHKMTSKEVSTKMASRLWLRVVTGKCLQKLAFLQKE